MIKFFTINQHDDVEDNTDDLMRFPGGEYHIKSEPLGFKTTRVAFLRSANASDLIALQIWADAMHRSNPGFTEIIAFIPYLPGARQDRAQPGEAFSAIVYANIINSCKLDAVYCVDPHSDVMPSHINNLHIVDINTEAYVKIAGRHNVVGIIAPDAGAHKRAFELARKFSLPVFQAFKHRDMTTGKLTGFSCENLPTLKPGEQLLIADDICDGGGTFKGLAKATKLNREQLVLWVTHGVFSDNAEDLGEYFSKIYCTSSHDGSFVYGKLQKVVSRIDILGLLFREVDVNGYEETV